MITIGLIQELNYISQALNVPVKSNIFIPLAKEFLSIDISNNFLDLFYNKEEIDNKVYNIRKIEINSI